MGFLFYGLALATSSLPECKGSPLKLKTLKIKISKWNNCHGTLINKNGDKYVGKFKNGRFHGNGEYTFADGGKFAGEFISDKPWNVTEYLKDGTITGKYLNGKWK